MSNKESRDAEDQEASSTHLNKNALNEAVLESLGSLARTELDGEASLSEHQSARARLLLKAQSEPSARRGANVFTNPRVGKVVGILGSLAAVFVALFVFLHGPKRPLTFIVGGHREAVNGVVRAGNEEVHVRFDDGTDIAFEPGSIGRIADVTPNGARIIVGEGRAHFDVVHRDGANWSVEAGSYVVRVTGTEFDVDWSPTKSSLRVTMQRGSVAVEGARSPVPALLAGNVLDVQPGGAVTIRDVGALALSSPPNAAESDKALANKPSASGAPTSPRASEHPESSGSPAASTAVAPSSTAVSSSALSSPGVSSSANASTPAPIRWKKRVESGDYATVVSEASAMGIDSVMSTAPLDDLVALSDAARYAGHGDIAKQALAAMRSRFPESSASHTAAFLLGRMADDRGAFKEAIGFYNEYLASGGPFSGEALGRKMIALDRSGNKSVARALAAEYLEEHPDGSYAAFARGLTEAP